MKKFLWAFLFLFFLPKFSQAALSDPNVVREKTFVIHLSTTISSGATSYFDLIALSSPTALTLWPHTYSIPADKGEIDISDINLVNDKASSASMSIKLGVVTAVTASTGSATYFFSKTSSNNSNNTDAVPTSYNYDTAFYRCKVIPQGSIDGLTPWIASNDKDSGVSSFTSTTTAGALTTPYGTTLNPRIGDIVLRAAASGGTLNLIIDVWYHAEP